MTDPAGRLHADTLAFVTAGLVHRLGNLIFTIQGHAQLAGQELSRDTILAATERGGRTLAVVRTLLGPMVEPAADAAELLAILVDLVRIPVREAGHAIACELPEPARFRGVQPGAFCPAVLETIRLLAQALPAGQAGTIRAALRDDAAHGIRGRGRDLGLVVRVDWRAAAGELPFPLPVEELRAELDRNLAGGSFRPAVSTLDAGLELGFGASGSEARADAVQA